jgi:hypothetical protein
MPCPLCEMFASYERQFARRVDTKTLAMSEENAQELLYMAIQIRGVTRATLRRVGNEAVPTMLCDLLDGLAHGIIEELSRKLNRPFQNNGRSASSPGDQPRLHGVQDVGGTIADARLGLPAARARG